MAPMTTLHCTLRFLTPAFLGDAEQNGRWRTPPIKAQLRQWWRVAYAADRRFAINVEVMRREEGLLFGNAWLENDFRKSLVRLRLDRWESGNLKNWNGLEQAPVTHPEVQRTRYKVGPHAYLGYGPLDGYVLPDGRSGTKLIEKIKTVVNVGESATFSIAVPDEHAPRIQRALWLMDRYGTVGGRSRNGWGSYDLSPGKDTPALAGQVPLRHWKDCLQLDWPHAIGQDEKGPLIWQTAKTYDDWKSLMRDLAIIKIGLRTQFVFKTTNNAPLPEERHWLSYPVTNHSVNSWDNNARLPNQLRFKVRRTQDGKLVGVIFHMPHLPPPAFGPNRATIERTWQTVHALLNELCRPSSSRTYSMISDQTRRSKLKSELDSVTLQRMKE